MEERVRPSPTGLAAIELTVAVGVFVLCAAICLGLLVRAELVSRRSEALTGAVSQARAAAACFQAAGGDLAETADLLEAQPPRGDTLTLSYDSGWTLTREEAAFSLTLTPASEEEPGLREASLLVTDAQGDTLVSWTVAALEDGS